MTVKAVLFDLDGTLLPMEQEKFTAVYFEELAKVLCPLGLPAEKLIAAVWAGTKAMVKNDGSRRNMDAFWDVFASESGLSPEKARPVSDKFYMREFHNARRETQSNPLAQDAVRAARRGGRSVVLANNPLFPLAGQLTRLGWIALKAEDFDLITSYESDSFCKPNPDYYRSIVARIGCREDECLMIGNDEREDMYAAASVGMQCYHVTDCSIPYPEKPWVGRRGSFSEMLGFLEQLP